MIADPVRSRAYVLNGSAGAAWELANGGLTAAEIAERVGAGRGESYEDLFGELAGAGLVELLPARDPAGAAPCAGRRGVGQAGAPRVLSAEPLEVLATVCNSAYGAAVGCRTEGSCATPYS